MGLRFTDTTNADARFTGVRLDFLVKLRHEADDDLATPGRFERAGKVAKTSTKSRAAIDRLNAIASDPARRAGVVASIRRCASAASYSRLSSNSLSFLTSTSTSNGFSMSSRMATVRAWL